MASDERGQATRIILLGKGMTVTKIVFVRASVQLAPRSLSFVLTALSTSRGLRDYFDFARSLSSA